MTINEFIRTAGTTFFGVEFVKLDGSMRRMVCQLRSFHQGRVCVVIPGQGYRSFYPGRVFRLTVRGKTLESQAALRHLHPSRRLRSGMPE